MQINSQWNRIVLAGARAIVIATVLLAGLRTAAADEGTFAQRRACKPDVFRLCGDFIPNHAAITDCLQRNKARLNPDCRAVFEGKLK